MKNIPEKERQVIRSELILIADRLVKKVGLSIPEARRAIQEILSVSI
jgi:hypothetical protein